MATVPAVLLLPIDKMAAAVLLPTLLVGLSAERLLLAVTDGLDAAGIDACLHQGVLYGIGAVIAESQVVFSRAALVTVSLNREAERGTERRPEPIPADRRERRICRSRSRRP
jgi:hypothetical protein